MPCVEWFAEQDACYQEEITAQQVALAARTSLARLATAASPVGAASGSNDKEWKP